MSPRSLSTSLLLLLLIVILAVGSAFATPPNVKVNSDTSPYLQNEQQIWVSPQNSNIVIADWRDWRLGYRRVAIGVTTDGGTSWSDELVPDNPWPKQSDPCLVGDQYGNFYACMLNYMDDGPSQIVVYKTTNNGLFWTGPVTTGLPGDYFEDKQFTTIDRTGGTYNGNYYISWSRFPNPTRIMVVRSTDGTASFGDTVLVGPSPYIPECGDYVDAGQFSIPIVDALGNLHVFWQGYDFIPGECAAYPAIRHVVSTDGGQTFTTSVVAFRNNFSYEWVDGVINVYGMPNGDCDISGGPYNNTIYISQCQYAEGYSGETDVTVRKSTDSGVTWTDRQAVNDDPPGQGCNQFHPWLVVNEDGVVLLIFYDQRDDPSHWKFNSYFSCSFDGGETYIKNMRISDVSSDPDDAKFAVNPVNYNEIIRPDGTVDLQGVTQIKPRAGLLAEYIGIHANHDTVNTIWTDTRNGNQDCYSARFNIPFNAPRLYLPANLAEVFSQDAAFRWSTCWHESEDSYRLEISKDATFITVDLVYDGLTDNNFTLPTDLDLDTYYWRVKAFRSNGDSTAYSDVRQFQAVGLQVMSTLPTQNQLNVAVGASVVATFSVDMDSTTVTESDFVVNGSQTGLHAGSMSYSPDTKTAILDPAVDFQVGEQIGVSLSSAIESIGGVPLTPGFCWNFIVQTAAAPAKFPTYERYPTGGDPTGFAAADFDGDGDIDLASALINEDSVSLIFNNGDGTFGSYTSYDGGTSPYDAVAGDFDGDGEVDLAVSNRTVDSLSILLNQGSGIMGSVTNYAVGDEPWIVVSADFDADGDLDLAVINRASEDVSVLLNNGDATFAAAVSYGAGASPRGLDAADIDNDGDIDLLTANTSDNNVWILANNGSGAFSLAGAFATAIFPYTVYAADLNGDGYVDISTANAGSIGVSILINLQNGGFSSHVDYDLGDQPTTAHCVADLDGDGDLDIATAGGNDHSGSILLNNGDGTFGPNEFYSDGWAPWTLTAADFDGDEDIDLATSNNMRVAILPNRDYLCGDADANQLVNISDAVYLIAYIFGGGSAPDPLVSGDVDCNDIVNISDAVYLIAYIFGGGPDPCADCQ
jgi:hypothetical protein